MKTIFITIPSYEDPQLIETIDSAISKASYPKNIFFAVALQYKKVKAPDMGKYFRNPNIKYTYYNVDTRPGVNQVRHDLQKFYNGQDYYLMIDSHSLFMDNWDEILIKEHEKVCKDLGHDKVILSQLVNNAMVLCNCYDTGDVCSEPHAINYYGYLPEDPHRKDEKPLMLPYLERKVYEGLVSSDNKNYMLSRAAAAGFFFAPGFWVGDVGVTDGIQATLEEILLSYTSYIKGWDICGLKSIHPVGHDNTKYNLLLYGKEDVIEKSYTRILDSSATVAQVNELLVFNSGKFSIDSPQRSPEDFWKEFGLSNELEFFRSRAPWN